MFLIFLFIILYSQFKKPDAAVTIYRLLPNNLTRKKKFFHAETFWYQKKGRRKNINNIYAAEKNSISSYATQEHSNNTLREHYKKLEPVCEIFSIYFNYCLGIVKRFAPEHSMKKILMPLQKLSVRRSGNKHV